MPDDWETAHFLNPSSAADATSDFDGDRVTALEEYLAGTNPSGKWKKQSFTPPASLSSYKIYPVAINDSGKFLVNAMSSAGGTHVRSFLVSMADQQWTEILPTTAMRSGTLGDVIGTALNDNGTVLFSWHDSGGDHGGMWFADQYASALRDHDDLALIGYRLNNFNEWVGYRVVDHAPVLYTNSYVDFGNATTLGSYQYCDIDDYGQVLGVFNLGGQDSIFLQMYGGANAVSTSIVSARPAFDNLTARWNLHAFFDEDGYASSDATSPMSAVGRGLDGNGRGLYFSPGSLSKGTVNVPLSSLSPDGMPAQLLGGAISREGAILAYTSSSSAIVVLTPDQDLDQDGIPDDWEDIHGLNKNYAADASADFDQDGISNLGEYLLGRNPVFNEETSMPQGGNPGQDLDGDGIPDFWEYAHKLNPNNHADAYSAPLTCVTDPDHDGYSNLEEYRLNTNPHGGATFQLKAIPQVPSATAINLSKITLGAQGNADCVYFSGTDTMGTAPVRWTVSKDDLSGSFGWYSSRNSSLLSVSATGVVASDGGNLIFHPSQEGQAIIAFGSTSNTAQLSYVKLSPGGKYLVAYRQRATDPTWEGIVWRMPDTSNGNSFGTPITLTAPTGIPAMDWSTLVVNDSGFVGGNTIVSSGVQRSVVWTLAGNGLSVSPAVLSLSGNTSSNLAGISNSAAPVIAGTVSQLNGTALKRYGATWLPTGSSTLFTAPDSYSSISAVSPGGVVAGVSYKDAGDAASGRSFVSRPSGSSWVTTGAGTYYPSAKVTSVNDWCEALGEQKFSSTTATVPVFWREGNAYKITDFLPARYYFEHVSSPLNANGSLLIQAVKDGRENYFLLAQEADTDGDGMPDVYENAHGLNPYLADDAAQDADGDKLSNLQEYRLGTDPRKKDTDGDGMDDKWEGDAGLDPLDSSDAALDPDGDGVTNIREYRLQTRPLGLYKYEAVPLQGDEYFNSIDDEGALITFRPGCTIKDRNYSDIPNAVGWAYNWRGRLAPGQARVERRIPFGDWDPGTPSEYHSTTVCTRTGGWVSGWHAGYSLPGVTLINGQVNLFTFDAKQELPPDSESISSGKWSMRDWSAVTAGLSPPTGWGTTPAVRAFSRSGSVLLIQGSATSQELTPTGDFIDSLPNQNPLPGFTSVSWTAVNDDGDALGRMVPGNVLAWHKKGGAVAQVVKPAGWGSDGWSMVSPDRITNEDLILVNRTRSFYDGSTRVELYTMDLNTGNATLIKSPGLSLGESVDLISQSGSNLVGGGLKPWVSAKGETILVENLQVTATTPSAGQSMAALGWTGMIFNEVNDKGRLTATVTTNAGTRQIVILTPLIDANGDGVPDDYAQEMQTLLAGSGNTTPINYGLEADNDGDGYTLRQELAMGTSDASANSRPAGGTTIDSDHDGIPDDEDADPYDRVIDWKRPDIRADFVIVPTKAQLQGQSVGPNRRGRILDFGGANDLASPLDIIDVSCRGEILYRKTISANNQFSFEYHFVDRTGVDNLVQGFDYSDPPSGMPSEDSEAVLVQRGWARIQSDVASATIHGIASYVAKDEHSYLYGYYKCEYHFGGNNPQTPLISSNQPIVESYYNFHLFNSQGDYTVVHSPSDVLYAPNNGSETPEQNFDQGTAGLYALSEDSDILASVTRSNAAGTGSQTSNYVIDTAGTGSQNLRSLPSPVGTPVNCSGLARMAFNRGDSLSKIERDLVVSSAGLYVAHRNGPFVLSGKAGASYVSKQGWLLYQNGVGNTAPSQLWADGKMQSLESVVDSVSSKDFPDFAVEKVLNMSEAGLITVVAVADGHRTFVNLVPVAVDTNSTSQKSQKAAQSVVPDDFRKISFSGIQKSEAKPQGDAEVDLPEEDNYVDAYNRTLRYDKSLVFQRVPDSELALQATLSWEGAPFSVNRGGTGSIGKGIPGYQEMLTTAAEQSIALDCGLFGSSWSTNLGAQARITYNCESLSPIDAAQHSVATRRIVTTDVAVPDEAGHVMRFSCNGDSGDFHISPSAFPGKSDISATLTRELYDSKDSLVLRKKFGVICVYNMPTGAPAFGGSGYLSGADVRGKIVAPLVSVKDIHENIVRFTSPVVGLGKVEVVGRPALNFSFNITQVAGGSGHSLFRLVDSITDAVQNTTRFEYSWQDVGGGARIPMLSRIIRPDGGVQKFSYESHAGLLRGSGDDVDIYLNSKGQGIHPPPVNRYSIADVRSTSDRINATYTHVNLTEIVNPAGAAWKIGYESTPQEDVVSVDATATVAVANTGSGEGKAKIPDGINLGSHPDLLRDIQVQVKKDILDSAAKEYEKSGGSELKQPAFDHNGPFSGYEEHSGIFAMPAAEGADVVSSITLPDGGKTTFSSDHSSAYYTGKTTADFGLPRLGDSEVHSSFPLMGFAQRQPGYTLVKDVLGNVTDYLFTDPVFLVIKDPGQNSAPAVNQSNARVRCDLLAHRSIQVRSFGTGTTPKKRVLYACDPRASFALEHSEDAQGNVISYIHGERLSSGTRFSTNKGWSVVGLNSETSGSLGDAGAEFPEPKYEVMGPVNQPFNPNNPTNPVTLSFNPDDPTHAPYPIKKFEYDADSRKMKSSTDRNGNRTIDTVVNGLRTQEDVYDVTGVLISRQKFFYADAPFAAFLKRSEVKKIPPQTGLDAGWVQDLVTTYEHDDLGHVKSMTIYPSGPSASGLTTSYAYDAAGRKTSETDPKGGTTNFYYDSVGHLVQVVYPLDSHQFRAVKNYRYDLSGRKVAELDELGNATLWEYDLLGRVIATGRDMNHSGKLDKGDLITRTQYNAAGLPVKVTDPNGNVTSTAYDDLLRPTAVTDAMGGVTRMDYSGPNSGSGLANGPGYKPTRIRNARGYVTIRVYDSQYRLEKETIEFRLPGDHAEGDEWQGDDWRTREPAESYAALTTYAYDANGNVCSTKKYRVANTASSAIETVTEYDGLNRPTAVTNAHNVANLENRTLTQYTTTGLVWKTTAFSGIESLKNETVTEYDGAGRKTTVWSANASQGDVQGTFPYNAFVTTSYDANGNVESISDCYGNQTTTAYDSRNRVTDIYAPAAPVYSTGGSTSLQQAHTHTEYDLAGNVIRVTDPRLMVTEKTYDAANRVTQTRVAKGSAIEAITSSTYDPNGNVVLATDANGAFTRNRYDALNRLIITATNPYTGNPAENLDAPAALDVLVYNFYDAGGNLIKVGDGNARFWGASMAASTTNFTYDGLNRKIGQAWDKGAQTWPAPHAPVSNLSWKYDGLVMTEATNARGQKATYSYDALLRPTRIAYIDGTPSVDFYYKGTANYTAGDASYVSGPGPLVGSVHSGTSTEKIYTDTATSYDHLGRVTSEVSAGETQRYGYDLLGNRNLVSYAQTERKLVTHYDSGNRVSEIIDTSNPVTDPRAYQASGNDKVTTYSYDIGGLVLRKGQANQTATINSYDLRGRVLTTITRSYPSSGFAVDLSGSDYSVPLTGSSSTSGYDAAGNVVHVLETYSGNQHREVRITYDWGQRITGEVRIENGTTTADSYGYDTGGNNREWRWSQDTSGNWVFNRFVVGNANTGNNANQLYGILKDGVQSAGNFPYDRTLFKTLYTYDADGNRSAKTIDPGTANEAVENYSYDQRNRLIGFTRKLVSTNQVQSECHYVYDERTRRTKTDEGGTVRRLSFAGGTYAQEYGAATGTQPALEIIRGSDMGGGVGGILYHDAGNGMVYSNYNSRGDVVSQTNNAGSAVTFQAKYKAFGTHSDTGTAIGRQRANSKDEDPTGLLNEGMRYRDLEAAVFITRDPAGMVDGPNTYIYVRQNPWTKWDPEGLWGWGESNGALVDGFWNHVFRPSIDFGVEAIVGHAEVTLLGRDMGPSVSKAGNNGRNFGRAIGLAQGITETAYGAAAIVTGVGVDAAGVGGAPLTLGSTLIAEVPGTAMIAGGALVGAHGVYSSYNGLKLGGKNYSESRPSSEIGDASPSGESAKETVEKEAAAKRGPKTDPTAPHNAKIRAEAERLVDEDNTIIAGGGGKEVLVPTPGGVKQGRRPDVLYETPMGEQRGLNVGKTKADGTPVKREVEALGDLNGPGKLPTDFVPYDR